MTANRGKAITIWQAPGRRGAGSNAAGFTHCISIEPGDTAKLAEAVQFDNCPALYKEGYRTGDKFQRADCILADIDNTHSENPEEWKTHDDVKAALPGVSFYYYPSRNHRKPKPRKDENGKDMEPWAARPKEHYIFPIDEITDVNAYTGYMQWLIDTFPALHFDEKVKSAAQLNFGVENPQVCYVRGDEQ
jgi:hypothetical protein